VFLDSFDHITPDYYENERMVGAEFPSVDYWLKLTSVDDERRFSMLSPLLSNKRILDFGCGGGGFINKAKSLASLVVGVDAEQATADYWGQGIYTDLDAVPESDFDVITAFHVVEHLHDPAAMLHKLGGLLSENGRMVVEVPSADDALLTLYDSPGFQEFTYWSQHLFLFNASNFKMLAEKAGLKVVALSQYQRYPLSNHLYWLSKGLPGGHQKWVFLDDPILNNAYAKALAEIGKSDTLVAHLELATKEDGVI